MPTSTAIPDELLAAYRSTAFHVSDREFEFVIRIGEPCAELVLCLNHFGATEAAYLTAWNPRSATRSTIENEAAQAHLEGDLAVGKWRLLHGAGIGVHSEWPPEPSVLVLGISRAAACELGQKYGQFASVVATLCTPPELVFLA